MRTAKSILSLLLLSISSVTLPLKVSAETLDEAVLRSGVVVGYACIPSPLIPGNTYTIRWMSQSYVPLLSKFKIIYSPDKSSNDYDIVEGNLYSTAPGDYQINDRRSTKYYFQGNYTVPVGKNGDALSGFWHAQNDGLWWMFGLFPTDAIRRPYGVAGKQFYVTIGSSSGLSCTQGSQGGQCVEYVRQYFGGSYFKMPGVCQFDPDPYKCPAYEAWGHWDLGFGRGKLPAANSIMVLGGWSTNPYGHIAVVTQVSCNPDGTFSLKAQESNWNYTNAPEKVDCNVTYTFYPDTSEVVRNNGSTRFPVLGFIYGSN